ncbi:helix-turn-helix domain-containing protein [Micromonospora sp. SH-82]|uniref:helix-turn-helix domain-containing protein n=1 Tax=Micromonospora sp. SH-82 TaxID=3132938 RepID=UPI003EBC102A
MPLPTSPVIRRARLGAELRQLRRQGALTLEQVCGRLGWASTSKLSRIELGQSRPDLADVLDLLDVYQVPDAQRDALIVIARDAATGRGWWKSLSEMGERQRVYAELEAGAATILEYQPALVPGLLQTPAYARARIEAGRWTDPGLDVDADVRARMARQEVLRRAHPPRYTAVLTETAADLVGVPPEVRTEQLRHLVDLGALSNVSIRVLPHGAALPADPLTPFSSYSFPDPADPRTVMLETLTSDVRLVAEPNLDRYAQLVDWLVGVALDEERSAELLTARAESEPSGESTRAMAPGPRSPVSGRG